MGSAEVAHEVTAMGVEAVEALDDLVGVGAWAGAVFPFARVRLDSTEVDFVLVSAVDAANGEVSRAVRAALAARPTRRAHLLAAARRVAIALDAAEVPFKWAAVRVRRGPDGASHAGLEVGTGIPLARPLSLLERPTQAPAPPAVAPRASAPPEVVRHASAHPAADHAFTPPPPRPHADFANLAPDGQAGPTVASPSLGQHDLAKAMHRAQGLLGEKQSAFERAIAGLGPGVLVTRDRAIEFPGGLRWTCDAVATYVASTGVWRWGWAVDDWSPALRAGSEKLALTGTNWELDALRVAQLSVPPDSAFRLALVSAWILGADACHFVRRDGVAEVAVALYGVR